MHPPVPIRFPMRIITCSWLVKLVWVPTDCKRSVLSVQRWLTLSFPSKPCGRDMQFKIERGSKHLIFNSDLQGLKVNGVEYISGKDGILIYDKTRGLWAD